MITSFSIEWSNCGEITVVDDVAIEITKVNRRKKLLTTGQYNGIGNAFINESIALRSEDCDYLFSLVEAIVAEAENQSYMEHVDDGFQWRLLIRHSDKHVRIIEGNASAPTAAYELELAIRDLLHAHIYRGRPYLFGICM